MDYLTNLNEQARLFLLSLGTGFALAGIYDAFWMLRILLRGRGAFAQAVQDLLFCVVFLAWNFFFFLAVSDGSLRAYAWLGEAVGAVAYALSLGVLVHRLGERLVWAGEQLWRVARQAVACPWRWMKKKITKTTTQHQEPEDWVQPSKKKAKRPLQTSKGLVYNKRETWNG